MEKLEIQLGKEYMTRGGQKVIIYATDKGGEHPVHGCVLLSDGTWVMQSWRLNGGYLLANCTNVDDSDIVSEWIETLDFDWDCLPKWADRWIAMYLNDGWWYCYENKPLIKGSIIWDNPNGCVDKIPLSHAPNNFIGDWKDSLHENQKYKK